MAHRVVVAGVAGSGKSTVGRRLAERLDASFVDGDDLHPPANVAKMAAGHPLTDQDRAPWLASIVRALAEDEDVVVACSALRRSYRDVLRSAPDVTIVLLHLDAEDARRRVEERGGHFMGPSMVESQFAALELPSAGEPRVVVVDADASIDLVVDRALLAVDELTGQTIGRSGGSLGTSGSGGS